MSQVQKNGSPEGSGKIHRPTEKPSPGEVWDQLTLESSHQALTYRPTREKRSALAKLVLDKKAMEARNLALDRVFPMPHDDGFIDQIDEGLRATMRALINGDSFWPLFVHGEAGRGKTCAALCLARLVFGSIYFTTRHLCNQLNTSQQGKLEWSHEGRGGTWWPDKLWVFISSASLVVLDEIGCREKVTDAHYDAVKEVVDCRHFKPLICISNLGLEDIARVYDARIASRLGAGTVIKLEGNDRRLD